MRMRAVAWMLAVAAGIASGASHAAGDEDLADLEVKVQYAYFTEDANLLASLVKSAARSGPALERYHLAHAQYRRALLLGGHDAKAASAAALSCVDQLERALKLESSFADAQALQGACHALLAAVQPYKAVLYGPLATRELGRALELAPDNPRVLLLAARELRDRPALLGRDRERAFQQLQRAARLADAATDPVPGEVTWGQAEAWLEVGLGFVERNDLGNARSAFERALAVAPDYLAAQRALAALRR